MWGEIASKIEINGFSNWSTCLSKWRNVADITLASAHLPPNAAAPRWQPWSGWMMCVITGAGDVWFVLWNSQAWLMSGEGSYTKTSQNDKHRPAVRGDTVNTHVCLNQTCLVVLFWRHTFTSFRVWASKHHTGSKCFWNLLQCVFRLWNEQWRPCRLLLLKV